MDFLGTIGVLRRRWYIVLPALLLSAVLTGVTYLSIPTRYESTATVVLTAPSRGGTFSPTTKPEDVQQVNPLLAFDGSLTTTAVIITQILRDPATEESLGVTADGTSSYIANTGDLGGPFVVVTTNSTSADDAQALAGRVVSRVGTELEDRQRQLGAAPSTFIQPQSLVQPTEAQAQIGGKVRFAGAAMVLTLMLTLAATYGTESVATRRARGPIGRPDPLGMRGAPGLGNTLPGPAGTVGDGQTFGSPVPVLAASVNGGPAPTPQAANDGIPRDGAHPAAAPHPSRVRPRTRPAPGQRSRPPLGPRPE